MALAGWQRLLAGAPWFRGEGSYPIAAYSEFIPPPRVGRKPYDADGGAYDEADPWGWPITEAEELLELRPGLDYLAARIVHALAELGHGRPVHGLSRRKLADNPAWPADLAARAPELTHERYVTLLPLALSRTQDDKGRVRWTLFGGSEQGPARAFWRSFFMTPRRQAPPGEGEAFVRRLLRAVYGETEGALADLRRAGFRILPQGTDLAYPFRGEEPLPAWTRPYLWAGGQPLTSVRYLLTFRPFAALPLAVRKAYLSGRLHLLPCPGSLLFWGTAGMRRLQSELPFALQVPLLHILSRYEGLDGVRIPQCGWLHEPHPDHPVPYEDDPHLWIANTYKRTHRWARVHRNEDELTVLAEEDKLAHVLFSTAEDDLGLYGKPMARNVQLWTHDYRLLLDGPRATREAIGAASQALARGGLFGYRFLFPAMRVGLYEVYWQRPLVAYHDPARGAAAVLPEAPLGYLTAYPAEKPDLARVGRLSRAVVELWPRLLRRPPYLAALELFRRPRDPHPHRTALGVCLLLDAWNLVGRQPLSRSFATRILPGHNHHTIDDWLAALPQRAADVPGTLPPAGLVEELEACLEPSDCGLAGESAIRNPQSAMGRTFRHTARRSFEVAYWRTIAGLAEGRYCNKSNADCVLDAATQALLEHHHRDLEALGEHLLDYYERVVAKAGLAGKALVGELPFRWHTDFDFAWMGGWLRNQEKVTYERDLIVVIPGRDRGRAVLMADHYDTAYMADRYDPAYGGTKARLAAAGADDNHSATAALLLAAPVFLELSRTGQLGCDVWLVHLTGEELPADCLGARHLSQLLVEGRLKMRTRTGRWRDLSAVRVQGVYVLDMVAHNNDHERDVFQIAPGTSRQSLWLAEQAHLANEAWNAGTVRWNRRPGRAGRGRRSPDPRQVPATAAHLPLRGEVRAASNPRSTLYNTDGQIFSDAGIPVVLFMENYDINREGYHDTHDTMANIDLDYGSALAAIAIEAVARAATEEPPAGPARPFPLIGPGVIGR